MSSMEYAILSVLVITSSFGVYVSRANNQTRAGTLEKFLFFLGMVAVVIGLALDITGVIDSPGMIVLLVVAVLCIFVYEPSTSSRKKSTGSES